MLEAWRVAALTRLETGGWRRGAVAQEAGDLRLETGGGKLEAGSWRREAGGGKLEAWRCGCFDEAGHWRLEA